MGIAFDCSNCRLEFETDESGAGQVIQCPNCKELITIPMRSERSGSRVTKSDGVEGRNYQGAAKKLSLPGVSRVDLEFQCSCESCGEIIGFPFEKAEKTVQCPHCLRLTTLKPPAGKQSAPPNWIVRVFRERWRVFVVGNWLCSAVILIGRTIYWTCTVGPQAKSVVTNGSMLPQLIAQTLFVTLIEAFAVKELVFSSDRRGSRGYVGVIAIQMFLILVIKNLNSQIYGGRWSLHGWSYYLDLYIFLAHVCYALFGPPRRMGRNPPLDRTTKR